MIDEKWKSKRSESLSRSWKERHAFTDGLAGTPFHNSWRGMVFTLKGKRIGVADEWKEFHGFKRDMLADYQPGLKLSRMDKTKPFSKSNCRWVDPADLMNFRMAFLEVNGERRTLREWSLIHELNYNGLRMRYFKGRNYTPEEVLFGKRRRPKRELMDQAELSEAAVRIKASKMLSSHRCRDGKKGHPPTNDITIDWFVENILRHACTYCGTDKHVGADRVDNAKPHTTANVVPCCVRCNSVRGDWFSHEDMKRVGRFLRDNVDNPPE